MAPILLSLASAEDKWRSWMGWPLWGSVDFSPYSDQTGKKKNNKDIEEIPEELSNRIENFPLCVQKDSQKMSWFNFFLYKMTLENQRMHLYI